MLANGVDLDASSGMGAGPTCPMHVKPHGRRGERWERANVESISSKHVLTYPIITLGELRYPTGASGG